MRGSTSTERFIFFSDFSSINRLFRGNIKYVLARKQNAPIFDIWYVTSPSGTLLSLLKLWLRGQNGLILDFTEFTLTYKLKRTKSPGLKPLGLDP